MSIIDQYSVDLRYFDPKRRALVAIAKEGVVLTRRVEDEDWQISARKKPDVTIEKWLENKRTNFLMLPTWASETHELPSLGDLEEWMFDGACETPTGDSVEPDGHGPDGAPSWLLALGLI